MPGVVGGPCAHFGGCAALITPYFVLKDEDEDSCDLLFVWALN